MDGRGALGVEAVRVIFCPDQRGIQGGLISAEVFGDAIGALGNARILGFDCFSNIVVQGNIEAIALAGQLRSQQVVDGFLAERSISHRLVRLLGGINGRRLGVR
ncbi:hypothetical protein D3C81_1182130 [compost metagenome]